MAKKQSENNRERTESESKCEMNIPKANLSDIVGIFFRQTQWLFETRSLAAIKLMLVLPQISRPYSGIVILTPDVQRRIRQSLGFSRSTYYPAINELEAAGALWKTYDLDSRTGELVKTRTEYAINPEMFCRFNMEDFVE